MVENEPNVLLEEHLCDRGILRILINVAAMLLCDAATTTYTGCDVRLPSEHVSFLNGKIVMLQAGSFGNPLHRST